MWRKFTSCLGWKEAAVKNLVGRLQILWIRAGLELAAVGKGDPGQNTTEYGVFIAGVVVVVLVVVGIFSGALKTLWEKVAALITGQ